MQSLVKSHLLRAQRSVQVIFTITYLLLSVFLWTQMNDDDNDDDGVS